MKYRAEWLRAIVYAVPLTTFFVLALVQFPDIHRDAQYYLQSAILWPMGQVTFAGSWVGSRVSAIWIYHTAFATFGQSIDAIAVALAIIKLLTALALSVVCVLSITQKWLATVASTTLAAFVFAMPSMNVPATDNIAMLVLVAMWMCWLAGRQIKSSILQLVVFPLIAGISYSVRMELLIFPLLLILAEIIDRRTVGGIRPTVLFLVSFTAGLISPTLLWGMWIPSIKPVSYTGAIAAYKPLIEYGRASNGPVSIELYNIAGISAGAPFDYWKILGATYTALGPRESNKLITAAGIEAVLANPLKIASTALSDAAALAGFPGSIDIHYTDTACDVTDLSTKLSELDRVRIETSGRFGDDAVYPTRTLLDHSIRWISKLRELIPSIAILVTIPAIFLLISFAVSSFAAFRFQETFWLCCPLYGAAILMLSSVSQGVVYRYIAPAVLLNTTATFIAVAELFKRNTR